MKATLVCPHCNLPQSENDSHCDSCGCPLDSSLVDSPAEPVKVLPSPSVVPELDSRPVEIRHDNGMIRIWEHRLGKFRWATPNGSEGEANSFCEAEDAANDAESSVVPVEVPAEELAGLKAVLEKSFETEPGRRVACQSDFRKDIQTAISQALRSHAAHLAKIQALEETLLRIATNSDGMARESGPREAGMWTVCANDARAALALPSA